MTDGNPISITSTRSQVPRNENVQLSSFSKLQVNLKPYKVNPNKSQDLDSKKPSINTPIKTVKFTSSLASLISNPAILARIEANPFLRAAILRNPYLAEVITYNPTLLNAIIKNPGLITSLISNSGFLSLIKDTPGLLSEIIKNPALSIESILERLTKKPETISLPNVKNNSSQVPHPLERSTIAAARGRPALRALLSKIKTIGAESFEIQKQQASQVLETKILQAKAPIKNIIPPTLKPATYFDSRLSIMNPALLALLGAAAFASNRGRVVPASGSVEELETQTEKQLDILQEIDPIHEVEEASEVHLMKETVA